MKINIESTEEYRRNAKRLAKKYKSLPDDLELFKKELIKNSNAGTSIGSKFRKIRIKIESKGKGKSGGGRIITYTAIVSITEKNILLVAIYDKGEQDIISLAELKRIVKG